jgi:glycerol kinase
MASTSTKITLGLAAGKVFKRQSEEVREHFRKKGWVFWSPEDIKTKVEALAYRGYENDPAIITAKILTR